MADYRLHKVNEIIDSYSRRELAEMVLDYQEGPEPTFHLLVKESISGMILADRIVPAEIPVNVSSMLSGIPINFTFKQL